MAKATIQTLTPVHIGSGNTYEANFDYVYFQQEKSVAVLDEQKVLDIIGKENLSQWISCIDNRQSLSQFLSQRKGNLQAADIAKRTIGVNGLQDGKEIREQVHSGNGDPLLPGSSLKGALKTVVWANLMFKHENLAKERNYLGITKTNWKTRQEEFKFEDSRLQKEFFGKDPNHDIFRLLMVGDAHFKQTACFKTEVVNLGYDDWNIKESITQFVEAIPKGESATLELQFNSNMSKNKKLERYLNNANKDLLDLQTLFPMVNRHSLRLIKSDLEYWQDEQGAPAVLGSFIEDLTAIQSQINACQPNECIFRLGWGTGFRNMTGAWNSLLTDDDYYDLVKSVRPKHAEDMVYPKTMRLLTGGMPLGYVKLSI